MEEEIEYKGIKYWAKTIDMGPGRGEVLVSDTKLNEILMEDMESNDNKEAKLATQIDEGIYYYLEAGEEQQMKESMMVKYIQGIL